MKAIILLSFLFTSFGFSEDYACQIPANPSWDIVSTTMFSPNDLVWVEGEYLYFYSNGRKSRSTVKVSHELEKRWRKLDRDWRQILKDFGIKRSNFKSFHRFKSSDKKKRYMYFYAESKDGLRYASMKIKHHQRSHRMMVPFTACPAIKELPKNFPKFSPLITCGIVKDKVITDELTGASWGLSPAGDTLEMTFYRATAFSGLLDSLDDESRVCTFGEKFEGVLYINSYWPYENKNY